MDQWDYWRLCEDFTVDDAACLIAGCLPEQTRHCFYDSGSEDFWPILLPPAYKALRNAVSVGRIKATMVHRDLSGELSDEYIRYHSNIVSLKGVVERKNNIPITVEFDVNPDWSKTTVSYEDLKAWLESRGIYPEFFFPHGKEDDVLVPGYLDCEHEYFSAKLKAAVDVWLAVSDSPPTANSPKEAIKVWLRRNASQYGLAKEDGTPNETGIEEIAKIVHWRGKGGAIKTPVPNSQTSEF